MPRPAQGHSEDQSGDDRASVASGRARREAFVPLPTSKPLLQTLLWKNPFCIFPPDVNQKVSTVNAPLASLARAITVIVGPPDFRQTACPARGLFICADCPATGPDDEIVAAMHKRRIAGSRSAVWRFFQRHKITFKKNVWRAPFASGFRRHGLTSLLQRIRSRDQFSRPRWRSAHPGPNKPCRRRCAIFLTRVPECRSTVRPSRFPPPANLRRSISA